jgi:hypothetical protein
MNKGDKGHHKHCESTCLARYMECVKEAKRAQKRLEFGDMDTALEWLRIHKTELVIGGTIVVVGGVVFTVATGGTGWLVLAPLAL